MLKTLPISIEIMRFYRVFDKDKKSLLKLYQIQIVVSSLQIIHSGTLIFRFSTKIFVHFVISIFKHKIHKILVIFAEVKL